MNNIDTKILYVIACVPSKKRRWFHHNVVNVSQKLYVNSDDLNWETSHIYALRRSLASNYHVSVLRRDNDATLKVRLGFTCLHI